MSLEPAVAPALDVSAALDPSAHQPTIDAMTDAVGGPSRAASDAVQTEPDVVASLAPRIEALLITSGRVLGPGRLAAALGLIAPPVVDADNPAPIDSSSLDAAAHAAPATLGGKRQRRKADPNARTPAQRIADAVALLNAQYESTGRSFRVETLSGGYRLMTRAEFRDDLARLHNAGAASRLSKASVETLAIIAYRQPVTRAQLEAIRGVSCGEVLRSLIERRLVDIAGRAEEFGRPILYATSKQFLQAFGLASIKDLPSVAELGFAKHAAAPGAPSGDAPNIAVEIKNA
jgi:segregation and condensation protein B